MSFPDRHGAVSGTVAPRYLGKLSTCQCQSLGLQCCLIRPIAFPRNSYFRHLWHKEISGKGDIFLPFGKSEKAFNFSFSRVSQNPFALSIFFWILGLVITIPRDNNPHLKRWYEDKRHQPGGNSMQVLLCACFSGSFMHVFSCLIYVFKIILWDNWGQKQQRK